MPTRTNVVDRGWALALTLRERLLLLRATPNARPSSGRRSAKVRLSKWYDLLGPAGLSRRLSAEHIALKELTAALQLRPSSRDVITFTWSDDLQSFLGCGSTSAARDLTTIVSPFVSVAVDRIHTLLARTGDPIQIDAGVLTSLQGELEWRLLKLALPTIALEINSRRLLNDLSGRTSRERFESFCVSFSDRGALRALFEDYPVLARLLSECTLRWIGGIEACVRALVADWHLVRRTFARNADPGAVVGISAAKGDFHRGGAVRVLSCRDGTTFVYKPRCLRIDAHFNQLLTWLNRQGWEPSFDTLAIVEAGNHGWMQHAPARQCSTRAQVERFYERIGGALAILFCLGASDCHFENVIADGEHPRFVDLETLFRPVLRRPRAKSESEDLLERTVMGVGLLPRRAISSEGIDGIDLSGLYGSPGQIMPFPSRVFEHMGTDEIHVSERPGRFEGGSNAPVLDGSRVNAGDYLASTSAGFARMYDLLASHRSELLADDGPLGWFACDSVRVVLRNTFTYSRLLEKSCHPDVLRNAVDRDWLLDALWWQSGSMNWASRIVPSEQRDLAVGDIPLFTTTASGTDLIDSEGNTIGGLIAVSGFDRARERIARLGPQDKGLQSWCIRTSITLAEAVERSSTAATLPDEALLLAKQIGDRLLETAVRIDRRIVWPTAGGVRETDNQLRWTDDELYDGVSGICLYLAYLGAVCGDTRYSDLAREIVAALVSSPVRARSRGGIGAYRGIGGRMYLLLQLAPLWHEETLFRHVEALVGDCSRAVAADRVFDVLSGSAGAILSLLAVHSVTRSGAALDAAVRAGDHLLAHKRRQRAGSVWPSSVSKTPLAGVVHGSAGFSWALASLWSASRKTRFRRAANEALRYERSLFNPVLGNWLDLRDDRHNGERTPRAVVAWCAGASGIGLSRLQLLAQLDDAQLHVEIEAAVRATLAEGAGARSHCLCHGDVGNAEFLIEAARLLARPSLKTFGESFLTGVVAAASADGLKCNGVTSRPVELPGLMTGIAGIGLGMLRFAAPDRVPCVLTLAPPPYAARANQSAPSSQGSSSVDKQKPSP